MVVVKVVGELMTLERVSPVIDDAVQVRVENK